MNLEDRKELYDAAIEKGWNKSLAGFHSWRAYLISKTPVNFLMIKAYDKWATPILEEKNPEKLVKKNVLGKVEFLVSYPILFASTINAYANLDDWRFLAGSLVGAGLGVYLNWKGELEMISSQKRIKELDIDLDKTVDKIFEKYKDN